MEDNLQTIDFSVDKIIYKNETNGFTVLSGVVGDFIEIAVGDMSTVEQGEDLTLIGEYIEHPSFGRQFKVKVCERKLPVTAKAIKNFLMSNSIKGIGNALATRIVNKFGDETLKKIEEDPSCLAQIKGISPNKLEKLKKEFEKIFTLRKLILYLEEYGVKSNYSIKLYSKYGVFSLEMVKKNPFILCDDEIGVPFGLADEIATKMGKEENGESRIESAVIYILKHNAVENGHTCIPKDIIIPVAINLLNVEREDIEEAIDKMEQKGKINKLKLSKDYIYMPSFYTAEEYIAIKISHLLNSCDLEEDVLETLIDLEEQRLNIKFVKLQRKAIMEAINNNIFLLTGGPGTGKTTILNSVISILEQRGLKMAICAPTGRAAKRLNELTDKEALTIHRLLGVQTKDNGTRQFIHNEHNKLDIQAIIIDEMSMVDCMLFYNLLKALKDDCKIILTGDADQLPSVSAGNVLRELIKSEMIPTVTLKDIFRQSAQSLIVTNAHSIIKGELPQLNIKDNDFFFINCEQEEKIANTVVSLISKRLPNSYGYSPFDDIQVICPSKKGIIGTFNLNNLIQDRINPYSGKKQEIRYGAYIFREGDKVMQIKNNYDIEWNEEGEEGLGIFNGDIGIIKKINKFSGTLKIQFESKEAIYTTDLLKQLELAYAITIHKSQGNEFKSVIMPLLCNYSEFYNRNLLYTGITRAKDILVIVGSQKSIQQMTNQVRINYRYTNLKEFIKREIEDED